MKTVRGFIRMVLGRSAILNKKLATVGVGLIEYSHLYGEYVDDQAEWVRLPQANVGCPTIPNLLITDEQVLVLADTFTTGHRPPVKGELGPDSCVVISKAGPVGLIWTCHLVFLVQRRSLSLTTTNARRRSRVPNF